MWRWVAGCVVAVCALAACSYSDGTTLTIRAHNMQNTLQPGQKLHLKAATASYKPAVGDIVEFAMPSGWDNSHVDAVSRVIATGGQTIRGADDNVQVSTDGGHTYRTLNESWVLVDGFDMDANFGPVTVPPGRLWLMGDHRNESLDSRFHCVRMGIQPDPTVPCDSTESTVPVSSIRAYRRG